MYSLHFYLNIVLLTNLVLPNVGMLMTPILHYWEMRSKYGLNNSSIESDEVFEHEEQFMLINVSAWVL